MKYVITGGAGLIRSHIAEELSKTMRPPSSIISFQAKRRILGMNHQIWSEPE